MLKKKNTEPKKTHERNPNTTYVVWRTGEVNLARIPNRIVNKCVNLNMCCRCYVQYKRRMS